MKTILLIFICIFLMSSPAFPQWARTNGPEGFAISSVTSIEGTIYAGTEVNGIYASTDDGINWTPLNTGIETRDVSSVISHAGYLFAGTFGFGVYRSSDGGQSWTAPLNAGNIAVTALVVSDSFIFAGTNSQGVWRSSDNGATWMQKLSGFTGILAMCVSGNTLLASTYGITYGSTNNGDNWFDVTALQGAAPWSFYCKDSLIIAGGVNKIYKSIDYGNSFTTINLNFSFGVVNIYDIAADGSAFYAATSYDGVYKSTDGGLNWFAANGGMGPKDVRAVTVSNASTIISGTHYVGVFRSTDQGANWHKSMSGFPAGSTIAEMLSTGTGIFAGTRGDGIYRTTDNGDSWTKLGENNDTLKYAAVQGMCEKDGAIYAGARLQFSSTVYKSTDDGSTWVRRDSGLPANLTFIASMATSGSNILAATDEGVYYSPDDGSTWYQSNIPVQNIPAIAAGSGYAYAVVPGIGIYRSADNGVSWTVSLQSAVDYIDVAAMDNNAFAGSFFSGGRYTTNFGSTWSVSSGFPPDASVFTLEPVGNGMVLAGTDLSPLWIYASFNNGAFYSPYSEGLGERAPVEAFAVADTFMFAGTDYNGVWRRLRPGIVSVQTQANVPQEFYLAQNFPNPFNPVTTIRYSLPEYGKVELIIYNNLGQEVRKLVNEKQAAGQKSVTWSGLDNHGREVSSGIYIYRLRAGNQLQTRKMILLR